LLYDLEWIASRLPASTARRKPRGAVLVLGDDDEFSGFVVREMSDSGRHAALVVRGAQCSRRADGAFTVDPMRPESVARLFELVEAEIGPPECIVNLWPIAQPLDPAEPETARAWQAIEAGCHPLLGLVSAMAHHKLDVSSLMLVTLGSQAVHSTREVVAPHSAPVWGLGRTIALEFTEIRTRLVDIDGASGLNAAFLAKELMSDAADAEIACREGQRFVSRLVRRKPDPDLAGRLGRSDLIRFDGCYLVTGGLGALGLEIAEWLINEGASDLLLVGRSAPSIAAGQRIDQLRKRGARVIVANADIADLAQTEAALRQAPSRIRGIIHAAGVLDDGVMLQQTWERFCKVLRPKVLGFLNLHGLARQYELDFFVDYSSAASLFGSAGQPNYAAANAFLDAAAQWRHASGVPALSINWGPLAEVGMAAAQLDQHKDRIRQRGVRPIAPEVSIRLLKELLTHNEPRAAVLDVDWPVFFAATETIGPIPAVLDIVRQEIGELEGSAPKAREGLLERLQGRDPADDYAIVQDYVKRSVGLILQLDGAQLDVDLPLIQYGLDSLMSVEFRSAMKREFSVDIPVVKLLRGMSIGDACNFLCEQVATAAGVVDPATVVSVVKEEEFIEGEI
jgi:NAD(P)-dependent dehydrogenase (short-subunit alcohol dehydrogenase family)/acyl carrier protein